MSADVDDVPGQGIPASIFVAGFATLGLVISLCFLAISPLLATADSIYYATHVALLRSRLDWRQRTE